MSVLRDRLLLLLSAAALAGLLLIGVFAVKGLGFGEPWTLLWLYTVLLFLVLIATAVLEIKRRSRSLRRRWPLVAALVVFFLGHVLVMSWLLPGVGAAWRMLHFYALGVVEVIVFGLMFERAYAWCVGRDNVKLRVSK